MRAALVAVLLVAGAGCGGTRSCKSGTGLLTISFAGAAAADQVQVLASLGGGSPVKGSFSHHAGSTVDTVELDFGSYPTGRSLSVTVLALQKGIIIARGAITATVQKGCTALSVTLGPETGDLSATSPVDMAGAGAQDFAFIDANRNLPPKQQGAPCNNGDNCVASVCIDGYCCNTYCTDVCAACNVPGKLGTCSPASGAPQNGRACLGGTAAPCAGSCDGVSTTQCTYPTVSCGSAPSCSAGVGTQAGACSMGSCNQPKSNCPDKLCGASACQTVAQMAVGANFTCALIADGTVRCWGGNKYGQLGQGGTDTTDRHVPTPVPGLTGVTSIAAGDDHVCAIVAGGLLKCWGANYTHQLGLGEPTNVADQSAHTTPASVCASGTGGSCVPFTNVTKVVASIENTCAIVAGTVYCWGANDSGELGNGTASTVPANANPATVCSGPTTCTTSLGNTIVDLTLGYYHACALDSSHNVYCWGDNQNGESFNPTTTAQENYPQVGSSVAIGAQVPIKISAGDHHTCAIISDGNTANNLVRCWGINLTGGATGPTPVTVCAAAGCGVNFTGATALAGLSGGVCAVAGGAVYCWGYNNSGEAGTGSLTPTNYTVPNKSLVMTGAIDVASESADGATVCAMLNAGGTMRCWGGNPLGQIGDGTVTNPQPTPTAQSW
jgi:alpha-tubulin suppressor-like RCC1 family protein